jgi:calcium/calmodulin-dependent protein kinase I
MASNGAPQTQAQVQPCRYKTGKTLGAGSYSVVKECVHIDTGRYYAAKVINKRLMAGREHMVRTHRIATPDTRLMRIRSGMRSLY